MAVTAPTVDEFLVRFPIFEGQEDLIEQLLLEVGRFVDERWAVDDQKIAMMYAVAHMIVTEGNADSLPVISETLGPISTTYAYPQQVADPWLLTEYGRRYWDLKKRNTGASIVVI